MHKTLQINQQEAESTKEMLKDRDRLAEDIMSSKEAIHNLREQLSDMSFKYGQSKND